MVVTLAVSCTDDGGNADPVTAQRIAALQSFAADPTLSGHQCADLSVSNGTVQLDATGSSLTATLQTEQPVAPTALHLVVHFGRGFPSFTCTDAEPERLAVIDATWPATAGSATFTVRGAPQCSTATLRLVGVAARAPDGQEVSLGDVTITNTAWQWWPPFECHRDDYVPG